MSPRKKSLSVINLDTTVTKNELRSDENDAKSQKVTFESLSVTLSRPPKSHLRVTFWLLNLCSEFRTFRLTRRIARLASFFKEVRAFKVSKIFSFLQSFKSLLAFPF